MKDSNNAHWNYQKYTKHDDIYIVESKLSTNTSVFIVHWWKWGVLFTPLKVF